MKTTRYLSLILIGVMLALLPAVVIAAPSPAPMRTGEALPAAAWWLVIHDQCNDTLHWISPSGEFAAIPRPVLPGEAAGTPCGYRPLHISQDGRTLVEIAPLASGRQGLGFYDLQSGTWLATHQTEVNEFAYLGGRYSSAANNHIAIGFANAATAPRAWRVILFDMTTGGPVDELRSNGSEIASFVGGEFLATAPVIPQVVLTAQNGITGAEQIHIRLDGFDGADPIGAIAWYPAGVPGVGQELVSSIYTEQDLDVLPDGRAIFAYNDPTYPVGPPPPMGSADTNAIGLLLPTSVGDTPAPQLYFADGVSTLYQPLWAADGTIALFRRTTGDPPVVYWISVGTAVLVPLADQPAQIFGVPTGFVYNTSDGIYFLDGTTGLVSGPIYSAPSLSGSAAFVWATAFGNPPLALDTIAASAGPGGPPPATGGPDLFVSEFSLDPATPIKGQTVNVRVGVYNQGNAAATGSFHIEWYPGENYPSPACAWDLDGMVATGGRILTCTYVGYPSPYASINTMVKVDTGNTIAETDESNNIYLQPISVSDSAAPPAAGQSDLFVSEFSLDPATPIKGQAVNVRVGVYNQGNAAATGSFHIEWYPGENYPSPACAWDLDGMVAHGGRILTCTYAGYPSPYASINTLVRIDTGNVISESNESNNSYAQAISVSDSAAPPPAGQPDLFVSEFSLDPATPTQGQPVNVRVGVYNQGNAAATGSFHIEWYPGENYPSPACAWDLDGMVAHGGRILTCTYAGYPSWYASINTLVRIDTGNVISESNESNNSYAQAISVMNVAAPTAVPVPTAVPTAVPPAGQADLYVSEFSLSPSTPTKGQPVNVRVGVYNQGNAAATGSFHIEWYPGENYPSPACSWDLDGMVAHGGRILTCTYAGYPSPYASINTMVRVDTGNVISESNESNNTYRQNISVNSP